MSEDIKPFRVAVPKADLDELAARLASWPDELPEAGWDYGIPRDYLQDLAEYWRVRYD
jgi:hypothetical protein